MVQTAVCSEPTPDGLNAAYFSQGHLGSPVRGICTPGSAWGDESKRPCPLGEAWARKRLRPQGSARATATKPRPYQPLRPLGAALANASSHGRDRGSLCGRAEAERFLQDWRERLQKFGLELHPDKTRLIEFGRFAANNRKQRGERKPETFNSLGFTYICGQSKKSGKFLVLRKTVRKRLLAKLKQVKDELRTRMHRPLAEVGKWLRSVVQGYFNYHAVPGNLVSLQRFRLEVSKRWRRVLFRRSQKSRMNWKRMAALVEQWLPLPTILHPYPNLRFDAQTSVVGAACGKGARADLGWGAPGNWRPYRDPAVRSVF